MRRCLPEDLESGQRSLRGWSLQEEERFEEKHCFQKIKTDVQVARLEAALESHREQGEAELRKARHQLALAQAEVHQAKQEGGQLKQALEDKRRENQILTEEVHQQNSKLVALNSERAGLEGDLEGNKAVLEQVQTSRDECKSLMVLNYSCSDS